MTATRDGTHRWHGPRSSRPESRAGRTEYPRGRDFRSGDARLTMSQTPDLIARSCPSVGQPRAQIPALAPTDYAQAMRREKDEQMALAALPGRRGARAGTVGSPVSVERARDHSA
ncbi:MAG: hypothetical protein JWM66_259 [Solirubrobacterales bacterium]|nr:hypothetical protein [Solirubrobacterales bacterium]